LYDRPKNASIEQTQQGSGDEKINVRQAREVGPSAVTGNHALQARRARTYSSNRLNI
jgi:hypothetical protein